MSTNQIGVVMQQALVTVLTVAGPIVLVTMVVGLAISVLQAATQVNEATLTFVPKLIVTAVLLLMFGSAMMGQLTDFTRMVFESAAQVGR